MENMDEDKIKFAVDCNAHTKDCNKNETYLLWILQICNFLTAETNATSTEDSLENRQHTPFLQLFRKLIVNQYVTTSLLVPKRFVTHLSRSSESARWRQKALKWKLLPVGVFVQLTLGCLCTF